MTIWWDMDGTIANLYGVEGWLPMLRAEQTTPYEQAATLWNMSLLARMMNKAQRAGYKLGVISWTSKGGSASYNQAVAEAKLKWLAKHLASVKFDEIEIVEYGMPKYQFKHTENDILFDDETPNREAWGDGAFDPEMMVNVLKHLTGRE